MKESAAAKLTTDQLTKTVNLDEIGVVSTAEVTGSEQALSQQRAMDAIEMSIGMSFDGYNLYALGSPKTDKRTIILNALEEAALSQRVPGDYCYLNNFDDAGEPLLVALAPGEGRTLRKLLQLFIAQARTMVPAAYETEEYRSKSQGLDEAFQKVQSEDAAELENEARQYDLAMLPTPAGFAFAPIAQGKVMEHEEFIALSDVERKRFQEAIKIMTEKLVERLRGYPARQQKLMEQQQALNEATAREVMVRLLANVRARFQSNDRVSVHLGRCLEALLENLDQFRSNKQESALQLLGGRSTDSFFQRFEVNVLVDSSEQQGAPVIYESNPSLENLVGKLDHRVEYGNFVTDFSHVRAGALHRANGGYLVLDAERMIQKPFAWEALKRALTDHSVRVESVSQLMNMTYSVSLEPEPMPLDVKVVLLGSRDLYHILRKYDPDFDGLFKIVADFADQVQWSDATVHAYVALLARLVAETGIRHLDGDAIARVIVYCSRQVEDREQLSTYISDVRDLLIESNYQAEKSASALIGRSDIVAAITARQHRLDRFRELVQANITRGVIRVETQGFKVAQVNGLSVVSIGQLRFGQPSRITATARIGRGEVVDIEREAQLGGQIHSKAVMIVAAYLGARYAKDFPLSLQASLVFEQTYSGVEGDSASIAEVCALISAITEYSINQSLAVTGSMDQHGFAQAVGGVNEKIEGFYHICKEQGLTGAQGVVIPASNVHHLMLNEEVLDAVGAGQFHIYTMDMVDDAVALLIAGHHDGLTLAEVNNAVGHKLRQFQMSLKEHFEKVQPEVERHA